MSSRRDLIIKSFQDWYAMCQSALAAEYSLISATSLENQRYHFGCQSVSLKITEDRSVIKVKYSGGCQFVQPWQMASRGSSFLDGHWMFSMNKFFNLHEISDKLFLESDRVEGSNIVIPTELLEVLTKQGYTLRWHVKWDGTNMQVYSDGEKLHAYTLGSVSIDIKMQGVLPDSPTFNQLCLSLLTSDQVKILHANPFHSAVFEMTSWYNRIVTDYGHDKKSATLYFLCDIAPDGLPRDSLFKSDSTVWPCDSKSSEGFIASLEAVFSDLVAGEGVYGKVPEGACMYAYKGDLRFPVAKAKRPAYLAQHRGITLNVGGDTDLCNVQVSFCKGEGDDLSEEVHVEHIHLFEAYLQRLATVIREYLPELTKCTGSGKEFAMHITSSTIPKWFHAVLFQARSKDQLPEVADVYDFIVSSLLTPDRNDNTRLGGLQKQGSAFWFQPSVPTPLPIPEEILPIPNGDETVKEDAPTMIVLLDFDDSIAKCKGCPEGAGIDDWYDGNDSFKDVAIHAKIEDVVAGYQNGGAKVFMLTGRPVALESDLRKCIEDNTTIRLDRFYGNPGGVPTVVYKSKVVAAVAAEFPDVRLMIHLDSHVEVLTVGAIASGSVRYMPLQCVDGEVSIAASTPKPVIVALVQPRGGGKSSVYGILAGRANEVGVPVSILSFDAIKLAMPDISGEAAHNLFMRKILQAQAAGHLVFLDLCHDKADFLKYMIIQEKTNAAEVYACSFLPWMPNPKKKHIKVPCSKYVDFCIDNCDKRIASGVNPSTLTDSKAVKEVCTRKAIGCLHQSLNKDRNVERFEMKEGWHSIEEMADLVWDRIQPLLGKDLLGKDANFFMGIPLDPGSLSAPPFDMVPVSLPHIAVFPPGGVTPANFTALGSKYVVMVGEQCNNGKVVACPTILFSTGPQPEHPHITLAMTRGTASVAGLHAMASLGHRHNDPLESRYTKMRGVLLPL
eukprot:m.200939 g.200939  ORF g.200939 m.200939 type:complete len:952 (+) comp25215_c0_seq1:154-3009(+)